jgi:Signal transduction histidine kinase involved in nitrogen fixation and metabolism regulation
LTWQTQQIAKGDFFQRVDFMGDFSQAFNTMTNALQESQDQLLVEIEKFNSLQN